MTASTKEPTLQSLQALTPLGLNRSGDKWEAIPNPKSRISARPLGQGSQHLIPMPLTSI